MRFIVAESLGRSNDFPDIGLATIIGIKIEESIEILDLLNIEAGVLGYYRFGEDSLLFLLDDGLLVDGAHRYFDSNII